MHPTIHRTIIRKTSKQQTPLRDLFGIFTYLHQAVADHQTKKRIALILSRERGMGNQFKRGDNAYNRAMALPPVLLYKTEAHVGDTVYLCHKDILRKIMLTTTGNTPPTNALEGRRLGDKVWLRTLNNDIEYRILKII